VATNVDDSSVIHVVAQRLVVHFDDNNASGGDELGAALEQKRRVTADADVAVDEQGRTPQALARKALED